jgi:hypothetical protein
LPGPPAYRWPRKTLTMKGDCHIAPVAAPEKAEVRSTAQPQCRSTLASVAGVVVVMALAGCAQSGALSAPTAKRLVIDPNGIAGVHFGSGALKWTAPNGLVFVEAPQTSKPTSPTATITEIKTGTCGNF